MSNSNIDKKDEQLTIKEKSSIDASIKEMLNYCASQANSYAGILANWLYALSLSAFAGVGWAFSQKIIDTSIVYIVWWFFASLISCVLASGLEWLRFILFSNRLLRKYAEFIENEKNMSEFFKEANEKKCWIWIISLVRFSGYIFLIGGMIYFFCHVKGV